MFNACITNEKGAFCNSLVEHRHECIHFLYTDRYTRCEFAEDVDQNSRSRCRCSAAIKMGRVKRKDFEYSMCCKKGERYKCQSSGFYTQCECCYSDMTGYWCKFLVSENGWVCTNIEARLYAEIQDL